MAVERIRFTPEEFKREFNIGDWVIVGLANNDRGQITAIGETSFIYKNWKRRHDYKSESIGYIGRTLGWVKAVPPEEG